MSEGRAELYLVKPIKGGSDFLKEETALWKQAEIINSFFYPWEIEERDSSLTFKSVHDNEWLYCLFQVLDEDIKFYVNRNDKVEVTYGDRVEIFFTPDKTLSSYYCLEIDPLGRVYDYRASYHRKFDPEWTWPDGHLIVEARQKENGYEVKCKISIESLKKIGVLNNGEIVAGLYRG